MEPTGTSRPSSPTGAQARRPLPERLFSRAFCALALAQLFSLFGESVLRFALPLYVLNLTGSGTTYGMVVAAAFVPYILLTPIGGVLADRIRKQRIMVALDVLLAVTSIAYLLLEGTANLVVLAIGVLMVLYAAQSVYQPTVQSSVAFLVPKSKVTSGVGIVTEVSTLTGIIGPLAGGMAFAAAGIEPILMISAAAFITSSVLLGIFVRIPHVKQQAAHANPLIIACDDLSCALRFLRTKSILGKCIIIVTLANLAIAAFLTVATPYLVTEHLGLTNQLMGFAEAAMGAGGLVGGLCASALPRRFTLKQTPLLLGIAALGLGALGAAFALPLAPMATYGMLLGCLALVMAACTAFSIAGIAFLQAEAPQEFVGKVMALTLSAANCATPTGQVIYGALLDVAPPAPIALAAAVVTLGLCAALHRVLVHEGILRASSAARP